MARGTEDRTPGGSTASDDGPRRPNRLELAGLVVAVVTAVVAIATFTYPGGLIHRDDHDSGPVTPGPTSQSNGGVTSGPSTVPPTTSPAQPPPPAAETRALTAFSPAVGGENLGAGPRGEPQSRTIACSSNQGTDKDRTVQWNFAGHWDQLRMTLTVAGQTDPDTAVQVEVFSGSTRVFNNAQLKVSSRSVAVQADISGSQAVAIRLTCQFSGLTVTLHNPAVSRQSP